MSIVVDELEALRRRPLPPWGRQIVVDATIWARVDRDWPGSWACPLKGNALLESLLAHIVAVAPRPITSAERDALVLAILWPDPKARELRTLRRLLGVDARRPVEPIGNWIASLQRVLAHRIADIQSDGTMVLGEDIGDAFLMAPLLARAVIAWAWCEQRGWERAA